LQGWFLIPHTGTGYTRRQKSSLLQFLQAVRREAQEPSALQGVQKSMKSTNHKLRLAGAVAVLATLALAVSCQGFFPKATLASLAVGPPAPTIDTGVTNNTVQMFAVGTFNGGGSGSLAVTWTISSTDDNATVTPGGLVTAAKAGSATVTATANQNPSITGTQTVTINLGDVNKLTLDSPNGYTISAPNNTASATAFAQSTSSGQVDVSATATWKTGDSTIATVQGGTAPVLITGVKVGTTTVTAQYISGGTTYTATANVTVQ